MTDLGCGKKNPLIRDGKSQDQRTLEELSTTYVGIDERTPAQLLQFARDFAGQVRYFDTTNAPNGDWTQFVEDDISTRIALISLTDPAPDKDEFGELVAVLEAHLLEFAQPDREEIWKNKLQETFTFLLGKINEIRIWLQATDDSEKFHSIILNLVKSRLRRQLGRLIGYHKGADALFGWGLDFAIIYAGFTTEWIDPQTATGSTWADYIAAVPTNTATYGSSAAVSDQMDAISYRLRILFNHLHEARVKIISESEQFLAETLEEWPSHNPHMALFLTFILLFKHAQEHLNTLVETHLNFYYTEVLRMEPNPPVEDSVYLVFELAKNTTRHLLEKGVQLRAGKDANNKELLYALDEESVFNRSLATDFRTIYRDPNDFDRLYAAPIANSGDGLGGDFENPDEPSWPTYGNDSLPKAEVGFAFASPVLQLSEGERVIKLTVLFDQTTFDEGDQARIDFINANNLQGVSVSNDKPDFTIYLTGEKGWLEPESVSITLPVGTPTLLITVTLPEDYPAIVSYSEKAHANGLSTTYPVLKAVLNMDETVNSYGMYSKMIVNQIQVEAEVTGVKNLVVANEASVLNSSKTFNPFGPIPGPGSRFMVGSTEVFAKKLDSLKLNIEWSKYPDNFNNHYSAYTGITPAITEANIVADVEILEGRKWRKLKHKLANGTYESVQLKVFLDNEFPEGAASSNSGTGDGNSIYNFDKIEYESGSTVASFLRSDTQVSFTDYNTSIPRGFIRISLGARDLGHSVFNSLYTDRVISLAKWDENGSLPKPVLPNEPYVPEVKGISFDYTTSETVDFVNTGLVDADVLTFDNRIEQLFHLQPFGMEEVHPETYRPFMGSDENDIYLLPQFDGVGAMFIGIEQADLYESNSLSLLVRIAEGTASPDLPEHLIPTWSYLKGNRWVELTEFEVPTDSTIGLRETGIVSFLLPLEADQEHTILPSDKVWLRVHPSNEAAVNEGNQQYAALVARSIGIYTQAAKATFQNQDNDPNHLAEPLVAETVTKLKVKQSEVKSVKQPYASFGGKMTEDSAEYFRRVSERLRHKDRAVTIWDYETMVLQEFPSIYKVKCINHTKKGSELAPGHVYMVVIPSQVNQNSVDQLQPRASVSTIESITEYLRKKISPFVKLKVANPTYERIQVEFDVMLMPGKDKGLYGAKLIEDLKAWLSPWAFKDGTEISFEGRIHRSVILNFVEELDYVDYVLDFKLYHYPYPDQEIAVEVLEAIATTPMSILVSHATHHPNVLDPVENQTVEVTDEC